MKTYNLIDDSYDDYEEREEFEQEESQDTVLEVEEQEKKQDSTEDEWQMFGELRVDDSYAIGNVYGVKNIYENFSHSELNDELYKIFSESPFFKKYETKKPIKSDILEIVIYFLEKMEDGDKYSMCEKIVGIADIMRIDYLTLYNEMPSKIRYKIMSELNEQYNVVKTRAKRLL